MLSFGNIVVLSIGAVALLLWLALYVIGNKHAAMFEAITDKEYPLREVYFVGFAFLEKTHYQYRGKANRQLKKELEILYEPKFADYYLRVVRSQQVTIAATVFVLAFIVYGLVNSIAVLMIFIVFSGLAYYYFGTTTRKKIEKRSDAILSDFSEVISKLTLMVNAGMILKEAWAQIAETGDGVIYIEMRRTVDEMNNGVAEVDALYRFGTRCVESEVKKFVSTIIQGLQKGNAELSAMLIAQSDEVWNMKKQMIERQSAKSAAKLIIPMGIMFIGILIMVIVPIFTNLGV
jgi:tight adherence protein C